MENIQLVTNGEEVRFAVEEIKKHPIIGLDTETTELEPHLGILRLIQIATPREVFILDLKNFENPLTNSELQPLRDLLANDENVKVLHNAKFDAKWLKYHLGGELGRLFDTLLSSQILAAGDPEVRHSLAEAAFRYLGVEVDKTQQVSNWNAELSASQYEYAAKDAEILLPLREKMVEKLKTDNLIKIAQLEFECVLPVANMELAGFYLDAVRWREQLAKVKIIQVKLADELQDLLAVGAIQGSLFGRTEINLDSHVQLNESLKRLGVPLPETTRQWQLEPLAKDYPVIAKLLEYRTVQKAITSYGENILEYINPVTGRLHADFRQIGAPTGRFSCNNPNIQQVPHGEEYRRCFRAPEGRKLVIADYSQIELRILADVTGDEGFINAFQSGADLHKTTAAQVFNVSIDEVTGEQRSFAKRLNFGVVYGIGAKRFAMMTGLSDDEAQNIMTRYFQTYRKLDAWLKEAARTAVRQREARTPLGRLARFRFDPQDRQQTSLTERNGKNMPIQGASADILKRALRLLHDGIHGTSANIVNIVHDEIIVECDAAEAGRIQQIVEDSMCAAGEEYVKKVPVKVESEIKDEWIK